MAFKIKSNGVATSIAALAFAVGCAAHNAQANSNEHCFYRGTMYSEGSEACQAGTEFRCQDGDWRSLATTCGDSPRVASRTCEFDGISFSTGSASCQGGSQYRCEDGVWRSIGMNCTLGDSPLRIVPSGRTCMFDGATVANSSTVCKSGTTFLCSDGEWVNLGTLCR